MSVDARHQILFKKQTGNIGQQLQKLRDSFRMAYLQYQSNKAFVLYGIIYTSAHTFAQMTYVFRIIRYLFPWQIIRTLSLARRKLLLHAASELLATISCAFKVYTTVMNCCFTVGQVRQTCHQLAPVIDRGHFRNYPAHLQRLTNEQCTRRRNEKKQRKVESTNGLSHRRLFSGSQIRRCRGSRNHFKRIMERQAIY
jgi:hypothetical protein